MIGLGTVINTAAVVVGGVLGLLFRKLINERIQNTVIPALGTCVIFFGIGGVMEKMLKVTDVTLSTQGSMMVILSMAFGSLLGAIINIEGLLERFGNFLKKKTGSGADDGFLDAFITASITVGIGAMAILGPIQDALDHNYTTLIAKSCLDFVFIALMSASLGKGCIFAAIPVAVFQGSMTAFAGLLRPVMTEAALNNLSMVGSLLIFCVGVNLVFNRKLPVANMLPSVILAVVFSYFGV